MKLVSGVTLTWPAAAFFILASEPSSRSGSTSARATISMPGSDLRQSIASFVPRSPQPTMATRILSEPAANARPPDDNMTPADTAAPAFNKSRRENGDFGSS